MRNKQGLPLATSLASVSLIYWFRLSLPFFFFFFFESRNGGADLAVVQSRKVHPSGVLSRRVTSRGTRLVDASSCVVYSSITSHVSRHPVGS